MREKSTMAPPFALEGDQGRHGGPRADLTEFRHGLVVQADATAVTVKAERATALEMIARHGPGSERRLTLAAGKGYDTAARSASTNASWSRRPSAGARPSPAWPR